MGKVAQIDIEAADPISTHMARDAPVAPTGTTVIEVRLASSVDDVLAGDQVRLVPPSVAKVLIARWPRTPR